MSDAHISLRNIRKTYGPAVAVDDLNLDIEEGKFIAIMGPSGCGKSTMLRMLAGLEDVTSGDILREGERINQLSIWEREMPMVWQSLALFPFLTVLENVEFGLRMRGVKAGERKRRSLECWKSWVWGILLIVRSINCPADSVSASPWHGVWSPNRRSCCWMNRCLHWTRIYQYRCRES